MCDRHHERQGKDETLKERDFIWGTGIYWAGSAEVATATRIDVSLPTSLAFHGWSPHFTSSHKTMNFPFVI